MENFDVFLRRGQLPWSEQKFCWKFRDPTVEIFFWKNTSFIFSGILMFWWKIEIVVKIELRFSKYCSQIESLVKNQQFGETIVSLVKKSKVWSKIESLIKIVSLIKKSKFRSKIERLVGKSKFWSKSKVCSKNQNFGQNRIFIMKNFQNMGQKSKVCFKVNILVKNRNFGQKLNSIKIPDQKIKKKRLNPYVLYVSRLRN